jgi:Ni,Fe-hydrogenase I large subunit
VSPSPPPPAAPPDSPAGRRVIVGPFNRVEGDLEVRLTVAQGMVAAAEVNATMFRGFESMLVGRHPMDALTIVPRICGICSVSQSIAAARALADAAGIAPPPNGQRMHNLMIACENLADHLTHFYLFFMPDFARACYAHRPWHAEARKRYAALAEPEPGARSVAATAARARWFELMGLMGGRWPHTGSLVPSGSTRAVTASERLRLWAKLREMRGFLESHTFGAPLETVAALSDATALQAWADGDARRAQSDLALWLEIAQDLILERLGRGAKQLMSYGAFAAPSGFGFSSGLFDLATQAVTPIPLSAITEDARSAWFDSATGPLHPSVGSTVPAPDKPGAYTWNKAPRLDGQVLEVGALARQAVDGHPLARALLQDGPATVFSRVVARLLETARILPLMERWVGALELGAPFAKPLPTFGRAHGVGLAEAARGALGHWLSIEDGRISHYQIIAPTSWNFSPRDSQGSPGALESALVGTPVDERASDDAHVAVQHVVRSFDPCMVCTVH